MTKKFSVESSLDRLCMRLRAAATLVQTLYNSDSESDH